MSKMWFFALIRNSDVAKCSNLPLNLQRHFYCILALTRWLKVTLIIIFLHKTYLCMGSHMLHSITSYLSAILE